MALLVADARALSAGQYELLVIYGDTAIGDGGGGFYVWDATATNADDGALWIKPTSVDSGSPGRWQRVWSPTNGNFQPLDAELTALASVTSAADRLPYFNGAGTATTCGLSNFARTLLDDGLASTARGTLGLGDMSLQAPATVAITGGTISGITDLAIADGGTGASDAATAFTNLKQPASTTATGVVELATDGETASGVVVQGNDSRLHAAVTLTGTPDYITIDPATQVITRSSVDLAADTTGTLALGSGGTGQTTAAAAFTALKQAATDTATGVVELATNAEVATGTDTTRAVTPAGAASRYQPLDAELTALAGTTSAANALPYFSGAGAATTTTLSAFGRTLIDDADNTTARTTLGLGVVATLASVDLSTGNVTGTLPFTSVANRAIVTQSTTTRTNTAADRGNWVRWTSTSAKTFTIANSVAAAGDVWAGINAAASNLTLVAGSGVTLTGSLTFAPNKSYSLIFSSASAADVMGGT